MIEIIIPCLMTLAAFIVGGLAILGVWALFSIITPEEK